MESHPPGKGVGVIPIKPGIFAKVDEEDYYKFAGKPWNINNEGYIRHTVWLGNGKTYGLYLHRAIMKPPKGKQVDHINHDKLDNRKCNLRICTVAENIRARKLSKRKTSKYRGVFWEKNRNHWRAAICYNKKVYKLGYFKNEEEAAYAYDSKAIELFGEYAKPNYTQIPTG